MQVGAKTGVADRIVGAHFFSPAHIMPLLEIVRTDKTSKQVGCVTLAQHGAGLPLFLHSRILDNMWLVSQLECLPAVQV